MQLAHIGLAQHDSMLRRIGLLVGIVLAGLILAGGVVSTASAKEQVGFFVAGEESEEESEQPRFEAESYTTYLDGSGDGYHVWGLAFGNLECPIDFFGELDSASAELNLSTFVYYAFCKTPFGGGATINNNGCHPTVDLLNVGPPYIGQFGMSCPEEKPYEFSINEGKCIISIPAQSGLDEVTLENTGEGAERAVGVAFEVSGLTYTLSGTFFTCAAFPGTYENGTYSGTVTLDGFDE